MQKEGGDPGLVGLVGAHFRGPPHIPGLHSLWGEDVPRRVRSCRELGEG